MQIKAKTMSTTFTNQRLSRHTSDSCHLAAAITKAASRQTYWTIRLLADRESVADAFCAYAYFRWVDDVIDAPAGSDQEKSAFLERQQSLLKACYLGEMLDQLCPEEQILADLVARDLPRPEQTIRDQEKHSGLRIYLSSMMAVMAFDHERRGRLITGSELADYSRLLSTAVTEALHYFIGRGCPTQPSKSRYQAVYGAHIVHMLRDAVEDTRLGYINLPREVFEANHLALHDFQSPTYQAWVASRVRLARYYLKAGRKYISQVGNLRCRLAGLAYTARFEWMLRLIERDGYRLRADYTERKSLMAGLWILWKILSSVLVRSKTDFSQVKTPGSTCQDSD
jgi:phytoene/squalene synthetase